MYLPSLHYMALVADSNICIGSSFWRQEEDPSQPITSKWYQLRDIMNCDLISYPDNNLIPRERDNLSNSPIQLFLVPTKLGVRDYHLYIKLVTTKAE